MTRIVHEFNRTLSKEELQVFLEVAKANRTGAGFLPTFAGASLLVMNTLTSAGLVEPRIGPQDFTYWLTEKGENFEPFAETGVSYMFYDPRYKVFDLQKKRAAAAEELTKYTVGQQVWVWCGRCWHLGTVVAKGKTRLKVEHYIASGALRRTSFPLSRVTTAKPQTQEKE